MLARPVRRAPSPRPLSGAASSAEAASTEPRLDNVLAFADRARSWLARARVLGRLHAIWALPVAARKVVYTDDVRVNVTNATGTAEDGGAGWIVVPLSAGRHRQIRLINLSGSDAIEARLSDTRRISPTARGVPVAAGATVEWRADARFILLTIPSLSAGASCLVEEEIL